MSLPVDGYTFEFSLLTTGNRYEPAQFAISETSDGVLARTNTLTFGDGAGSTSGLFEVRFERHQGGFSWRSHAAHPEAIEGIRVAIEGLPLCLGMIPLGGPGAAEFSLGPDARCTGQSLSHGLYRGKRVESALDLADRNPGRRGASAARSLLCLVILALLWTIA